MDRTRNLHQNIVLGMDLSRSGPGALAVDFDDAKRPINLEEAMNGGERPRQEFDLSQFGPLEVRVVAAIIEDEASCRAVNELFAQEDRGLIASATDEIRRRLYGNGNATGDEHLPSPHDPSEPIEFIGYMLRELEDFAPHVASIVGWLRLHLANA